MALGWRGQYLRYREFFLNIMALYKGRADLRAFLEVILSLGAITIFLLFALKPTALTIISLYNEIQDKQKTVAALEQKVGNLKTAANVFTQNQAVIPDIDAAVSNLPQPDTAAKQIQGLAAKDSVSILGISTGQVTLVGAIPPKKSSTNLKPLPESAKEMPVSISVKGNFASLASFIKDFENLRTIAKFDIVGISSSTTDTGQVIVAVISIRFPFIGK